MRGKRSTYFIRWVDLSRYEGRVIILASTTLSDQMIRNPPAAIALHPNWTESPLNMRELNPLHHVGDERPAESLTKLGHDMPVLVKVVHSHDCLTRQELPHHDEPIDLTSHAEVHHVTDPNKPDDSACDTHSEEPLDIKKDCQSESERSDPAKSDNTGVEEHKEITIHDAAPEQVAADIAKAVTATQPKQVVHVHKKEKKPEVSNNIFGRLVEQEYGVFAVKASDYSADEQTRFAKMTVGGILAKKPEEKVDLVAPEFAKIYDSQPIEKDGATNNWDSFATADKTVTPPSFETPAISIAAALDAKKTPNALSRLIFGERRGSAIGSAVDTPEMLASPPVELADSEVFPDEDETVLADLTSDGKVVRKKSIIMGAMDLIRGKKKDSSVVHEMSKVDEDESSDLDNGGVCL
jgi:hypothetical protein